MGPHVLSSIETLQFGRLRAVSAATCANKAPGQHKDVIKKEKSTIAHGCRKLCLLKATVGRNWT